MSSPVVVNQRGRARLDGDLKGKHMKITFYYDDKKINFQMHDVFNEKAIRREANKIIKKRWSYAMGKIKAIEWVY